VIPEPTPGVKRRKSTKTMLAAKCKTCQRDTDPSQNRIVFCDSCSTAYHQYCHSPPISNEVVTVLEKEWLCGPCARSKESVVQGTENLVSAENLSIDEVGPTSWGICLHANICRNARISSPSHSLSSSLCSFMLQYDTRNFLYSHQMSPTFCRTRRRLPRDHINQPALLHYNQSPRSLLPSLKRRTQLHLLLKHKSYEKWACALNQG